MISCFLETAITSIDEDDVSPQKFLSDYVVTHTSLLSAFKMIDNVSDFFSPSLCYYSLLGSLPMGSDDVVYYCEQTKVTYTLNSQNCHYLLLFMLGGGHLYDHIMCMYWTCIELRQGEIILHWCLLKFKTNTSTGLLILWMTLFVFDILKITHCYVAGIHLTGNHSNWNVKVELAAHTMYYSHMTLKEEMKVWGFTETWHKEYSLYTVNALTCWTVWNVDCHIVYIKSTYELGLQYTLSIHADNSTDMN